MHDHYEFLLHECDTLKAAAQSLQREYATLVAERNQLRKDLAEMRGSLTLRYPPGPLKAPHSESPGDRPSVPLGG